MKCTIPVSLAGAVALALAASAFAAGSGLPGDNGRPGDGIRGKPNPQKTSRPAPMPVARVRAPAIALQVKAAEAIAEGCKQYALGVAVVNAAGEPTLIYVPDGTTPSHGYMALRKAYSAITFKTNTSQIVSKSQTDPAFAAQVKADPNLVAYSGGILLKAGVETIGAIGVSGAEPGGHDEECGLIGLAKIKDELK